jgi:hypothetical protein
MERYRFPKDNPDEAMFLVAFGEKDGISKVWSGEVAVANGELEALRGYKFDSTDKILPPDKFEVAARSAGKKKKRQASEPDAGLMMTLVAGPAAEVRIASTLGNLSFKPSEIEAGSPKLMLDGGARITRLPVARDIGSTWWEDDYPSIASDRDGGLWVAWSGYHSDRDELGLRHYKDGQWSNYLPVPGNYGDVWWPQVVVDEKQNPWVIWAQQDKNNWDIYAAGFDKQTNLWSDIERISDDPGVDSNPQVAITPAGDLYVVWQGFRGKTSDILLRVRHAGKWSETYTVSHAERNNWEPSIALDSKGRAWIAWDTYRNGNYDVYLKNFERGKFGDEIPIATSPRFDARASVMADRADRIWVAWEQGDFNWGKDVGHTNPAKYKGTPLGGERELRVAVYADGKLQAPKQQPDEAAIEGTASFQPRLFLDGNGNSGILFNRRMEGKGGRSYWEQQLTFYRGDKWSAPVPLPLSWDQPCTRGSVVAAPGGALWSVYATDNRAYATPLRPVRSQIYAAHMPSLKAGQPVLTAPVAETEQPGLSHPDEAGDLKAIHGYRAKTGGEQLQILRGDTHRHTVVSWDGSPKDGSILEFYRYMIDAAGMDWGNVSDHQGGGTYYDYYWWINQKLTDMYYVTESYTSLYGYERGMLYPDGHRNVVSTLRSLHVLPFLRKLEFGKMRQPGEVPPGGGEMAENDVKYLYKYLARTESISIPHTSGTDMGTDWRDNDPNVEPVVEIFQGARNSYEQLGGPLTAKDEASSPGGYRPDGFVNNAWAKGYRLGVIASSDHGSTHMSYALVYSKDRSRQGIVEAIKKRHTYGATDNIVLDYHMGDHFMGDEFEAAGAQPIVIHVRGTKKVAAIHIVRDQKIIHSVNPAAQVADVNFRDNATTPGKHYYYVRVEQEDGQVAWSSPIWVKYK